MEFCFPFSIWLWTLNSACLGMVTGVTGVIHILHYNDSAGTPLKSCGICLKFWRWNKWQWWNMATVLKNLLCDVQLACGSVPFKPTVANIDNKWTDWKCLSGQVHWKKGAVATSFTCISDWAVVYYLTASNTDYTKYNLHNIYSTNYETCINIYYTNILIRTR